MTPPRQYIREVDEPDQAWDMIVGAGPGLEHTDRAGCWIDSDIPANDPDDPDATLSTFIPWDPDVGQAAYIEAVESAMEAWGDNFEGLRVELSWRGTDA